MIKKKFQNHIRLIVLIISAFLFTFYLIGNNISHEKLKKELNEQNIYELSFEYIYSEKRADIYYMICRPPSSQSEIIDLIEDHFTATKLDDLFIRTQTLIDKLITSDGLTRKFDVILYLHFIHPSDILPIGIFPKNIYDPELNVSEQEIVTLTVTSTASGYALEYYWNSNYC